MFRENIHLFRGISIILVVFSHCYNLGVCVFGQNDNIVASIFRMLISGSSSFFVFISGFLFLAIYKTNRDYRKFIFKKIKFVYLPFLIFITLDLVYLIFRVILSFVTHNSKFSYYWDRIFKYDYYSTYFNGNSFITFGILWYIPFIMFVYLLSPIFLLYSRSKFNIKISILLFSFLISFMIFRSSAADTLLIFKNLIYFLPFYLLGIVFYQFEENIYLNVNSFHLVVLFLVSLTLGLITFTLPSIFIEKYDLMMVQKILFCILFFVFFKKIKNESKILETLANYSFGVFFVHPLILLVVEQFINYSNISYKTDSFLVYLFIASVVLISSLGLVISIKKLIGFRSKYFMGV